MIRVVIDPGHGGENLGADYNGLLEKDLNLVVADALKTELEQYEGIEVYLTRTEDREMTLKERVAIAKNCKADFLYSLHFNMSEEHTLFGSEVWISAFGENYALGKDFAGFCLGELDNLGIYRRGIKTRLNKHGTDYYGIIRIATQNSIPSCIIEHCHLDRPEDEGYYESEEVLRKLGKSDATAIAKYYGLSSDILGVNYSTIPRTDTEIPASVMGPDKTECSYASLEVVDLKKEQENIVAEIRLSARDEESGINYYSISSDGGKTFSELKAWKDTPNSDAETITVEIPVSYDIPLSFVSYIYNGYDLEKITNLVQIGEIPNPNRASEKIENQSEESTSEKLIDVPSGYTKQSEEINAELFLCAVAGSLVFSLLLIFGFVKILFNKKKRKKNKRKKQKRSE